MIHLPNKRRKGMRQIQNKIYFTVLEFFQRIATVLVNNARLTNLYEVTMNRQYFDENSSLNAEYYN